MKKLILIIILALSIIPGQNNDSQTIPSQIMDTEPIIPMTPITFWTRPNNEIEATFPLFMGGRDCKEPGCARNPVIMRQGAEGP